MVMVKKLGSYLYQLSHLINCEKRFSFVINSLSFLHDEYTHHKGGPADKGLRKW